VKAGVGMFYTLAIGCFAVSFWLLRADAIALLALIPAALHFGWQVVTLDPADGANPLVRFRANRWAGALVAAACFVVGNA
jgi:4-hydroxybenzoate polyprenyltransferase